VDYWFWCKERVFTVAVAKTGLVVPTGPQEARLGLLIWVTEKGEDQKKRRISRSQKVSSVSLRLRFTVLDEF
jgi:hypothetical protein